MEERMDIVVVGFEPGASWESSVGALQRTFGVDFETAARVVGRLPTTVKRNAEPDLARRYAVALRSIGARVELRRSTPPPPAPPELPEWWGQLPGLDDASEIVKSPTLAAWEPASSSRPAPAAAALPARRVPPPPPVPAFVPPPPVPEWDDHAEDERSFWEAIPSALVMPLRGAGFKWLLWCFGYGAFLSLLLLGCRGLGLFGLALAVIFGSVLVGLAAGYFRASLWGALSSEDEPAAMPEVDPDTLLGEYLMPGIVLTVFLVVSQLLYVHWLVTSIRVAPEPLAVLFDPTGWLLLLGPSIYWPIGLALRALEGNLAFWDCFRAFRMVLGAPLELLATLVIGAIAFLVPWVATTVVAAGAGWILGGIALPLLWTVPWVYSHAVQGALMGHLLRTQPELGQ